MPAEAQDLTQPAHRRRRGSGHTRRQNLAAEDEDAEEALGLGPNLRPTRPSQVVPTRLAQGRHDCIVPLRNRHALPALLLHLPLLPPLMGRNSLAVTLDRVNRVRTIGTVEDGTDSPTISPVGVPEMNGGENIAGTRDPTKEIGIKHQVIHILARIIGMTHKISQVMEVDLRPGIDQGPRL